jgi:hypothetical protein
MRVILNEKEADNVFGSLKAKKLSLLFKVSLKTISNWRRAETSLPQYVFRKILMLTKTNENDVIYRVVDDNWNNSVSARIGGLTRHKIHGNFGTVEGRIKGGLKSVLFHKSINKSKFKQRKKIKIPRKSAKLAELLVVMVTFQIIKY